MPDYRRHRVAGGSYFSTINLLDRDRPLLVEHIDLLRTSVRRVRELMPRACSKDVYPFIIEP